MGKIRASNRKAIAIDITSISFSEEMRTDLEKAKIMTTCLVLHTLLKEFNPKVLL